MKRYQYRMTLHELCDKLNFHLDAIRAYEGQQERRGYITASESIYLQGHKREYAALEKRAARRKDYRRVVLGQ